MAEPFDLNLRHLRALGAIAECGNISGAARQAGLSQPALTQGLAKLEAQFGTALFDRHPHGMEVTPTGIKVTELAPGVTREEIAAASGVELSFA